MRSYRHKITPPPIGTAFVLIVSTTRLVFRISSESVPITNGNSSPETPKTSPERSQNYPKWRPGVAKEAHEVLDMPRMQHAAGWGGGPGRPRSGFCRHFALTRATSSVISGRNGCRRWSRKPHKILPKIDVKIDTPKVWKKH